MPGNSFGEAFRITTWGESHGICIGVVIDGCPAGIEIDDKTISAMLKKRKSNIKSGGTERKEPDKPKIVSGTFNGMTTGTPIAIIIENKNAKPDSYQDIANIYRPGHGDITYDAKYGIRDWRGGGRASARETVARVAAGAVAKAILNKEKIEIKAYTVSLGKIKVENFDIKEAENNMFFCPDKNATEAMKESVKKAKKEGDSLGGILKIVAKGVPPGLGEPVFDKLDADIAKALTSIGAIKGVEIGAGFSASKMKGSENNDSIYPDGFATNNAGGILAGISNGDDIVAYVSVKPIPSIRVCQDTIDNKGNTKKISIKGRHDVSAIPRINVVCEAMVSIVIADHLLRQRIKYSLNNSL